MTTGKAEDMAALGYDYADEAYRLIRLAEMQLDMAAATCATVENEVCSERAACKRLADDLGKRLDNLADHSV